MFTQDRILREISEAREKDRRDAASWVHALQREQERVERMQLQSEEARQHFEEVRQQLDKARLQAEQMLRKAEEAQRQAEQSLREGCLEDGHAKGYTEGVWLGRVQAYEECLGRTPRPETELGALSVEQLRELAEQLRDELGLTRPMAATR